MASKGISKYAKHLNPGIGRMSEMVLAGGRGSYVWTDQGEEDRYLDFSTGIGVANTGHCHPKVVKAVQDQAGRMLHAQINIAYHNRMLELIGKMGDIMPKGRDKSGASPLDNFFFWNSGAEAVEASIKLARHATKKKNVIVFKGSYHGRTFGTMPLTTSKTVYSAGFGPFMGGISVAPFPYCAHCDRPRRDGGCCNYPLQQLELMTRTESAPSDTAAVLVEPVQGEGGYVVPPDGFIQGLREFCDKHNMLLILDEVQTGMGRTGEYWACEHWGVVPDVLIFAKGIASGMPLSGIATRQELAASQPAGSMGGTYAGNIVSCASAIATLDVFKEEGVLENCRQRGRQLREGLIRISGGSNGKVGNRFPIRDIRGLGLMMGLEFDAPPGSGVSGKVSKACLNRKMILLTTSAFETIRFIPPLTITEAEMNEGLEIFEQAMVEVFEK